MIECFIKDLPVAKKLSPDFVDAFEEFIPNWLNSIVRPYEEAKSKGADVLELVNYLDLGGTGATRYESDGIGYYLYQSSGLTHLGFDSGHPSSRPWNWYTLFRAAYPEVDKDETKRISNFMYYSPYLRRLYNTQTQYSVVADRVDSYFKELTGDPDVGFSLGSSSFVYFNREAKDYIDRHHKLD